MHIPDGFLDTRTLVATSVLSVTGIGRALRSVGKRLPRRKIPLMGLAAAFIFAAQMLNFPIAGGTSGHLIGGVLAAVLLGPDAAVVVMTTVLMVQCFLFADGGVLALGANIFNMAIIAPVCGYAVFRLFSKVVQGRTGFFAAVMFAAWMSTVLASICCAGELAVSHIAPWNLAFPAMSGIHMMIGIGEGLITVLVLAAVLATRPELLSAGDVAGTEAVVRLRDGWVYAVLAVIGLLLFVAPWASPLPDGLEKVATALGFESHASTTSLVRSPLSEYRIPGIGSPALATVFAGAIGAVLVLGLSLFVAKLLAKKSTAGSSR